MMSLNLHKGRTWIVTFEGREIDCYIRDEQVFYVSPRGLGYQSALRLHFEDFAGFYVKGKPVSSYQFYNAVLDTKFSKKYTEQMYLIWSFSDMPVEATVNVIEETVCAAPVAEIAEQTDLSVDRACLVDPIEGLPPTELVVEDGTMVLHKGLWHEECWYSEECLYYWGFDKDGYECAFQLSIHDIDMTYINGWHFTQEQTVEYFKQYRATLENELAVAPLIMAHYHLNEMVLDYVPARRFLHTESVAELALDSDGELLYRHPYSSVWLRCSVAGCTVSLPDGTLAILTPGATLITMVCRDFSSWLITLSHIFNGHYGW